MLEESNDVLVIGVRRVDGHDAYRRVGCKICDAVQGMTTMAERVDKGDIDDAITVTVDIELDDVDKIVKVNEHVAQSSHDQLVVVHERNP